MKNLELSFGAPLVNHVGLLVTVAMRGLAVWALWNLFVAPLGVPEINVPHAIGLVLFTTVMLPGDTTKINLIGRMILGQEEAKQEFIRDHAPNDDEVNMAIWIRGIGYPAVVIAVAIAIWLVS